MLILYQQKNATKLMMTLSKNRKKYFYNLSAIVQMFFSIITTAGAITKATIGIPILMCSSVFLCILFNLFILLVFKVIVLLVSFNTWFQSNNLMNILRLY